MSEKKRNKIIVPVILCLCFLFTNIIWDNNVYASSNLKSNVINYIENQERHMSYTGDKYIIDFIITSEWDTGYSVQIKIFNTCDTTIENWKLLFDLKSDIESIWNANIAKHTENSYFISNCGYNQDVKKDEFVEFEFNCVGSFIDFPSTISIVNSISNINNNEYSVEYILESEWNDGFIASINIKNIGKNTIEDWKLNFEYDRNIINIWNAKINSHNGNIYEIENVGYNSIISPGETIKIGFNGKDGCSSDGIMELSLCGYQAENENFENDNDNDNDNGNDDNEATCNPTFIDLINKVNEVEKEENKELVYSDEDKIIKFAKGDTIDSVIHDIFLYTNEYKNVTITWKSSNENIVRNDGTVIRPQKGIEKVVLSACMLFDDNNYIVKDYEVTILGLPEYNTDELKDYDIYDLIELNDGKDTDYILDSNGYLKSFYGRFSDIKVLNSEDAINVFYNIKSLTGIENPHNELHLTNVHKDEYETIYKFEQYYKNIVVYDSIFTVAVDNAGNTSFLLSDYKAISENLSIEPTITNEYAEKIILDAIPNSYIYKLDDADKLFVYDDGTSSHLVWKINIYLETKMEYVDIGCYEILIDANDGKIIYANKISRSDDPNLSMNKDLEGIDRVISNRAHIFLLDFLDYLSLRDRKRNISVGRSGSLFEIVIINYGLEDDWKPDEVSAMFNIGASYDFYMDNFGRDSYDNDNSRTWLFLNDDMKDNSSYDGNGFIMIGDNSAPNRYPGSCARGLDTIGHEFTHGVVTEETKLKYVGTGGAIDEGYSDIFGNYIDSLNYNGVPDWSHGNHQMLSGVGFRSLSDPNSTGHPAKFGDSYFQDYKKDSSDCYGVHTNGTILGYAAYLMENGDTAKGISAISDPDMVKSIWYHSLCYGYSSNTDFYDVRLNVTLAARNLGLSDSDIDIVKNIFDEVNITKSSSDEGKEYFEDTWYYFIKSFLGETTDYSICLIGNVSSADTDSIYCNNIPLKDVNVVLKTTYSDSSISECTSNYDGNYILKIYDNDYNLIEYNKDGYLPEIQYIDGTFDSKNNYCENVELIPIDYNGYGNIEGIIFDSQTGEKVSGVLMRFRKGINNKKYEVEAEIVSNEYGCYSINLPAGNYCVELLSPFGDEYSYLQSYFNVIVIGGATISDQNGVISRSLNDDKMRIVLTWDELPLDLDAHLEGSYFNEKFHVYYNKKYYIHDGHTIAFLDVDDVSSYGPETITVVDSKKTKFTYYVYNFSQNPDIKLSNAVVWVYLNDETLRFNVPVDGHGLKWDVFYYNGFSHVIVPIDKIS